MLDVSAPVRDALASGRPVVALESTLIAHGLPWPRNLEVARALEADLLAAGVTPATIAVIDGTPTAGLDAEQLERIARGDGVRKLGARDLPFACAQRVTGATTVSSTTHLAHQAGIRVFATGGIGGIHRAQHRGRFPILRGVQDSEPSPFLRDESADLLVLAETPMVVVSAGVKSLLDVPATVERLETLGVGVAGWRTDRFPSFYLPDSGLPVDWTVGNGAEVAEAALARDALGIRSAILVANPVREGIDPAEHDRALEEGLALATAGGVTGQAVTPFLLAHLHLATAGRSLEVNIEVVRGNAAVAAEIAGALASLSR